MLGSCTSRVASSIRASAASTPAGSLRASARAKKVHAVAVVGQAADIFHRHEELAGGGRAEVGALVVDDANDSEGATLIANVHFEELIDFEIGAAGETG